MITLTACRTLPRRSIDKSMKRLWYIPHRLIRTAGAAADAIRVSEWIETQKGLDSEPDEKELFIAMHTCAYRYSHPRGNKRNYNAQREQWYRRWLIIREYIIEQNLGLVYALPNRFRTREADDDDLFSEALFALARAAERFNPWQGFRFSTYACPAILRTCARWGKRENAYHKRFPVHYDISIEQSDGAKDAQADLYVERLRRALDKNLGDLTELESSILTQRFLSKDMPKKTFREIGEQIGLSKERVRQIQNNALGKLREVMKADHVLE